MITELAILDIRPGLSPDFEKAFARAEKIIAGAKGYLGHEMKKCLEREDRYVLLVRWERLEDHTEGFRGSEAYREWKSLLHHFYDPFPVVEHYDESKRQN